MGENAGGITRLPAEPAAPTPHEADRGPDPTDHPDSIPDAGQKEEIAEFQADIREVKNLRARYEADLKEVKDMRARWEAHLKNVENLRARCEADLEDVKEVKAQYETALREAKEAKAQYEAGLKEAKEAKAWYDAGLKELKAKVQAIEDRRHAASDAANGTGEGEEAGQPGADVSPAEQQDQQALEPEDSWERRPRKTGAVLNGWAIALVTLRGVLYFIPRTPPLVVYLVGFVVMPIAVLALVVFVPALWKAWKRRRGISD